MVKNEYEALGYVSLYFSVKKRLEKLDMSLCTGRRDDECYFYLGFVKKYEGKKFTSIYDLISFLDGFEYANSLIKDKNKPQ